MVGTSVVGTDAEGRLVRQRAWGLLVLVPALLFVVVVFAAPYNAFHIDLYLSGTPDRFAATVVRAGRSDARASLWLDNVFVLSWWLIVPRLLRAGLMRWAPERRRSFGVWRATPMLAIAAAMLDFVENALSLASVGKLRPSPTMVLAVTAVAWLKWLCYMVAIAGLLALVIGPLLAPVVRPLMRRLTAGADRLAGSHPPAPAASRDQAADEVAVDAAGAPVQPAIGICVSGGGVRAASVALGALRRLDAARSGQPSLFARSSWLVAVSGGAYTVGGWRVTRGLAGEGRAQDGAERDGLFDHEHPWARTVRARRRFLDNGSLSIVGGIANVVVRTVLVLGGIASAVNLVAAGAGRAIRSRGLHDDFPFVDATDQARIGLRELVPIRLVLPGAVLLLVAAALALMAYSRSSAEQRSRLTAPAIGLALAGGALSLALVGVPIAVVYGRRTFDVVPAVDHADNVAGLLGLLCALAVLGAVGGALFAQLKRRWMRLGGVALALTLVLYAGKIVDAHAFAYQSGWTSWPLPFTNARLPLWSVAAMWLVVLECVAAHRLTLGGVYRKRLAATFALVDGPSSPLPPMSYSAEPLWSAYSQPLRPTGPQLIVAATAHTSDDTFCGLPAYGFTFRADRITLHDRTDGTSASVATNAYPTGSWWDGYPRGWIVSRSMALSGAAFASAMGRQALGTTNALLVALNLRLGAWVPNPRFAQWFADPATAPRVHLGYLVKELFGRYRPDRDAFVYVADGGHRENLGLVELLRERPDVVLCIDASGDAPGSFQTLREATELALIELGVDIDIDLVNLGGATPPAAVLPVDCAAEGIIKYPESLGGGTGRLLYGRHQLSEVASPALLQYGALDGRFPNYSTADQFLSEVEFDQLVMLGEHVGDRIVRLFEAGTP